MEVEKCDPFGCKTETKVDIEATTKLQEEQPLGRFNGLGTYGDRNHLAFEEIKEAWSNSSSMSEFLDSDFAISSCSIFDSLVLESIIDVFKPEPKLEEEWA